MPQDARQLGNTSEEDIHGLILLHSQAKLFNPRHHARRTPSHDIQVQNHICHFRQGKAQREERVITRSLGVTVATADGAGDLSTEEVCDR